jgi:hypothetical protein
MSSALDWDQELGYCLVFTRAYRYRPLSGYGAYYKRVELLLRNQLVLGRN